jgi:N-acetylmuramoyl-L-alanine amidase
MVRYRPGWKVRHLAVLAFVFVFSILFTFRASAEDSTAACFNATGSPTIALDAGHGGTDPGTSNVNGLVERELTLDLALRTKDVLVDHGYKVCLTRTLQFPNWSNTQRAQYANSVGAVRFVLIHLNGSTTESANYTKTFWGKKNKDLAFSQTMSKVLYPALSKDVAGQTVNLTDGGVGQFATGALLKSNMPGTLAETVFLTNNAEATRLLDESATGRRQQIAAALAQGIVTSLK